MAYKNSLNIKSDEAYRLARELSERTGESMTKAVVVALQERLDRVKVDRVKKETEAEFVARIMALTKGCRDEWREPFLSTDHGDLLYDERGLPRDC